MSHINTTLTEKLAELTNRLFWMDEEGFPFQVFAWETDRITLDQLLQLTHHSRGTPVEVMSVDEFFAPAIEKRDEQSQQNIVKVNRYKALLETLKYNLSDIKVYRVGKGQVYVYIIGTTRDDNLAGISTQVLET